MISVYIELITFLVAEDDVVEDGLGDAHGGQDMLVDVGALGAQLGHLLVHCFGPLDRAVKGFGRHFVLLPQSLETKKKMILQ